MFLLTRTYKIIIIFSLLLVCYINSHMVSEISGSQGEEYDWKKFSSFRETKRIVVKTVECMTQKCPAVSKAHENVHRVQRCNAFTLSLRFDVTRLRVPVHQKKYFRSV